MGTDTPKTVIVTGGSSGIGAATSRLLAEAGYSVMIADRDQDRGAALADELSFLHPSVIFYCLDGTDEESVAGLVKDTVGRFGKLDGAVNCAGIPQNGKAVVDLSESEWALGITVNLTAMFYCIKHQGAAMLKHRNGSIVCVSSAAATKGLVNSSEYCASKAGVTGLVRAAAIDLAEYNIRVNALLLGATDTPLAHRSRAANPKIEGTLPVPLGRMAEAREIAASAAWLVSDAGSYATGACFAIDGGSSIA